MELLGAGAARHARQLPIGRHNVVADQALLHALQQQHRVIPNYAKNWDDSNDTCDLSVTRCC